MSLFGDIGNFFGSIFNQDDQRKKQQQQQQQAPTIQRQAAPTIQVRTANAPSLSMPQLQTPADQQQNNQPQAPQLGGVTIHQAPQNDAPLKVVGPDPSAQPAQRPQSFLDRINNFAASANNAGARTLIGGAADAVNLFRDGFDTAKMHEDKQNLLNSLHLGNTNETRAGLSTGVDFNSNEAKVGQVVGGIEGGLNPVTPIVDGVGNFGSTIGATLATNHLLNKNYDPAAIMAASDAYTQPYGVSSQNSNGQNALSIGGGALNLALGLAGADALIPRPTKIRSLTNNVPEGEAIPAGSVSNEISTLREPTPVEITPNEVPTAEPVVQTPRDPNSPITQSPTTNKAPAITSPNRPAPTVATQPPAIDITGNVTPAPVPMQGVQVAADAPQVAPTVLKAPVNTADAEVAAAQKAIDEAATQPATQPAPAEVTPLESPQAAHARQIAEATTPVDPQAALEAQAADAAAQASAQSVPDYTSPVKNNRTASVPGNNAAKYTTGDTALDNIVHDSIVAHKGTAGTSSARADALDEVGVTASKRAKIRDIATRSVDKDTGKISDQGVEAIKRVLAGEDRVRPTSPTRTMNEMPVSDTPTAATSLDQAPVSSETGKLGTITRNAVLDGSINTQEGIDKAISDVTTAAHAEAENTGASLSDIIKKGQQVWQKSKEVGHDLTTNEAADLFNGKFTPEQQAVYKNYSQEIGTLRDRSGFSLDGGHQGAWYGPRQALTETGDSAEFNPAMVNEISRNRDQATGGIASDMLDTSATPYEHAIRRYANAPDASAQIMVDAVETHPVTGQPTGIKVPDTAKQQLEETMTEVVAKRDEALKLQDAGDIEGAKALQGEVTDDINRAFNDFIDEIPGSGKARREAINNVKDMRGTYMQTTMQSFSLSNVVNRVADQGSRLVYGAQQPLVKAVSKIVSPTLKGKALAGTEATVLNTSKEASQAAKEFSRGTLMREISDNFKTNMSMAGAGRNIVTKGIAKLEALPRAASTALTQMGDLSTQNIQKALELGASRPEAQGLKTAEDYTKYYAEYVNTAKFQEDLTKVQAMNNPRIGLAGVKGDNMASGGKVSNFLSKYLDNGVKTAAKAVGIKENRLVNEANDYVKGNITGYAGVGSRVLGTTANAAALGIPRIRSALKIAASGDPAAVAHATQVASQSIADAVALYGTAGASALLLKNSGGMVGFTGAQPTQGSSESSFNKANNIPANQWYLNIGDKRVYFDPSRPLGGPGVAANIAASIATGKNPASAAGNSISQIYNQAGGSSLPDTIVNAKNALDPSTPEADRQYAGKQLQATLAPSTGFLNNIANITDPSKRAPETFVDNIKANVPGLRTQVAEAQDSRGMTIANSKQASAGSSLFSVGKNTDSATVQGDDPVGAEITRLQKISGDVFPTNSNTNAKKNKETQGYASMLLGDKLYQSADDAGKAEMLKNVLQGTSTKDINSSLAPEDKQALLDHKLLGDKAKAWLDDSNNAASYYMADYNNAKASGTLTADDENLQHKSGKKYMAVAAKVDKDTGVDTQVKELYQQITQSDFKDMLNPDSENYDPETATKLYHYDEARTKAGVSDAKFTDRQKYSLNAKGKGSGSGSKAARNFAFASMPSSLIGTGGTGNGKGNGYADNAPLFKPIAELQAPAAKEIPKGRTISVKKGITL